jgi:hypothetical protein
MTIAGRFVDRESRKRNTAIEYVIGNLEGNDPGTNDERARFDYRPSGLRTPTQASRTCW